MPIVLSSSFENAANHNIYPVVTAAHQAVGPPVQGFKRCVRFQRRHFIRECFFEDPNLRGLETSDAFLVECAGLNDSCDSCVEAVMAIHTDGRSNFWDSLPQTFGLPKWNELIEDRADKLIVLS